MLFQQVSYALQFSDNVQTLSQDFFQEYNLSYFVFIRWFGREQGYGLLASNAYIADSFYKNKFYQKIDYDTNPFYQQDGASLWSTSMLYDSGDRDMFQFLQQNFSLPNGITLVRKQEKYSDFFFLTAGVENYGANDFYLNQIEQVENFCTQFTDSANGLINDVAKNRIYLPTDEKANRFSYEKLFEPQQLTQRETQCLYWAAHGKSAIEIGIILKISSRTVEQYIENCKKKLGCYKLPHAIYKATKMGII